MALRSWLSGRRRLDFLIVGAEKAGTTALFSYLRRQPDVYIPFNKELNFFDRDHRYRDGTDFSALHRWFLPAPKSCLLGEATPTYLMNPRCFERIRAYNPAIKIVALLRCPVRRAYSAWNYRRARLRDSRDFMTAVRVEIESGGDLSVARENKYRYVTAGLYASQIRQAQQIFEPGNLLLIKYEDFTRDQETWVARAAAFIGSSAPVRIPRIRRSNVWGYQAPLQKDQFDTLFPYYEADIAEVESLTGWNCDDWRTFERRTPKAPQIPGYNLKDLKAPTRELVLSGSGNSPENLLHPSGA
jgi:hypothetical protein